MKRRQAASWLMAAVLAHVPAAAQAEPAEVSPVALRAVLRADERAVGTWFWSWTGFFAGVSVAQTVVVAASDDPRIYDPAAVGAVSSSLGLVGLGLTEVRPDLAAQIPQDDSALWEHLRLQARREAAGKAWPNHVLAASVAVGGGLWLAVARDKPVEAAVNTAVSLVVGELQLWTQPTRALDAWRRWRPGVEP